MILLFYLIALSQPTFAAEDPRGVVGSVTSVVTIPNGEILIAGDFTSVRGNSIARVAVLKENGRPSDTFLPTGSPNGPVTKALVDHQGRIVVLGRFSKIGQKSVRQMARYFPDGRLDPSFDLGSGFDNDVTDFAVLPDGRILVVGYFQKKGLWNVQGAALLKESGALDPSFNIDGALFGKQYRGRPKFVQIDSFGNVHLIGGFEQIQPSGLYLDLELDTQLRVTKGRPFRHLNKPVAFEFLTDNTVVVAWENRLERIDANGLTLQSLTPPGKIGAIRRAGGVLWVGYRNGVPDTLQALDTFSLRPLSGFASPLRRLNGDILAIGLGNADELIIGGSFEWSGPYHTDNLVKISGGSLDPSFMPGIPQWMPQPTPVDSMRGNWKFESGSASCSLGAEVHDAQVSVLRSPRGGVQVSATLTGRREFWDSDPPGSPPSIEWKRFTESRSTCEVLFTQGMPDLYGIIQPDCSPAIPEVRPYLQSRQAFHYPNLSREGDPWSINISKAEEGRLMLEMISHRCTFRVALKQDSADPDTRPIDVGE